MERALELAALNSPAEPPQNYDTLLRQISSNAFFLFGATAPSGPQPPHLRGSYITLNDFRNEKKKVIANKVCVLIFSAIFV